MIRNFCVAIIALLMTMPAYARETVEDCKDLRGLYYDAIKRGDTLASIDLVAREYEVSAQRYSEYGKRFYVEKRKHVKDFDGPDISSPTSYMRATRLDFMDANGERCQSWIYLEPMTELEWAIEVDTRKGNAIKTGGAMMGVYSRALTLMGNAADNGGRINPEQLKEATSYIDAGCPLSDDEKKLYSETAPLGGFTGTMPGEPDPVYTAFKPGVSGFLMGPSCFAMAMFDLTKRLSAAPDTSENFKTDLAEAATGATVGEEEAIGGRKSTPIIMSDVGMKETDEDGRTIEITTMKRFIDSTEYVPTRMVISGTVEEKGKKTPFQLEKDYLGYNTIDGTPLLEPSSEILRMSGMLSDKDMAALRKAEQELAAFESQLAAMPANQRAMVQNMVDQQIAQMRSLANSGGIEFEIVTDEVIVYNDTGKRVSFSADAQTRLVQTIQHHLRTLGYYQGLTAGVLDQATESAISTYQTDHGKPVTGQPSQQLADELEAAVEALPR